MFQLHIKASKITSINKISTRKQKISINDKTCLRFVSNKKYCRKLVDEFNFINLLKTISNINKGAASILEIWDKIVIKFIYFIH